MRAVYANLVCKVEQSVRNPRSIAQLLSRAKKFFRSTCPVDTSPPCPPPAIPLVDEDISGGLQDEIDKGLQILSRSTTASDTDHTSAIPSQLAAYTCETSSKSDSVGSELSTSVTTVTAAPGSVGVGSIHSLGDRISCSYERSNIVHEDNQAEDSARDPATHPSPTRPSNASFSQSDAVGPPSVLVCLPVDSWWISSHIS